MTEEEMKIRVYRAKSWIERAKALHEDDLDERFIFGWIAVNALYGKPKYLEDIGRESKEFADLKDFLKMICTAPGMADKIKTALMPIKPRLDELLRNEFLLKVIPNDFGPIRAGFQ